VSFTAAIVSFSAAIVNFSAAVASLSAAVASFSAAIAIYFPFRQQQNGDFEQGKRILNLTLGIVFTNSFSIDMDALTGKAGHDPIVSFFLFIDMDALTGKNYADRRYISIKRKKEYVVRNYADRR
jgi:hypothetical protein